MLVSYISPWEEPGPAGEELFSRAIRQAVPGHAAAMWMQIGCEAHHADAAWFFLLGFFDCWILLIYNGYFGLLDPSVMGKDLSLGNFRCF